MPLSAPPTPFPDFNTSVLPAGAELVRLHDPSFGGAAPNPCFGGRTRFAPIHQPNGVCIPTLYAAASFEAAVYESVFHEVPHSDADKYVRLDKVMSRAVSRLRTTIDLKLADLFEPDLNKLLLTRADLIDTPASAYVETARWAEAFHQADGDLAGLAWTSKRCDTAPAYVFFGDRLPPDAIEVTERTDLSASAPLVEQIRALGARAGITLTV